MIGDPYLQDNPKVFFWGAGNLHPAQPHPAYRYKEYLELLSDVMGIPDLDDRLKAYFRKNKIEKLYIYGDMEISSIIYRLLSNCVEIGNFIARDKSRDEICGKKVICLCDYKPGKDDVVLVLNYHFFNNIKRDFDFKGFEGKLLRLDKLFGEI
jgi:hypothetical protein